MRPSINIEKAIFQARFKPALSFYDNLFKLNAIFNYFPNWQTDRLKITLKDYEKKHSLTIQHDSLTYETDSFKKKNEDEIISLLADNLTQITSNEKITRFGHRFFCLVPLEITFEELVKVLNLKFFSKEYINIFENEPNDSTVTITSIHKGIDYRLQIGPMHNHEVPNFIRFNVENHIDINSSKKYNELSKLVENYPKTSLYLDLDLSIRIGDSVVILNDFYESSSLAFNEISNKIIDYLFVEKIKL